LYFVDGPSKCASSSHDVTVSKFSDELQFFVSDVRFAFFRCFWTKWWEGRLLKIRWIKSWKQLTYRKERC